MKLRRAVVSLSSLVATLALATGAAALLSCDPFNPTYDQLLCTSGGECPGDMVCSEGVCLAAAAQVCGDGLIIGTEICDDGNLADGDGCNASCAAATCYVPVTHATVTSALADQACPTIYLHTGRHDDRVTIARDVTLVGVGIAPPILDGGATGTVVTVEPEITASLRGLILSNGRAPSGGGVLNRGTLSLDSVTVTGNTAAADAMPSGGGIANLGGALTLLSSEVSQNHLEITGSAGVLRGAGIFSEGGTVRLDGGSAVAENDITLTGKAGFTGLGAGLAANAAAITLTGASAVRGNLIAMDGLPLGQAIATGGGLHLTGGSLTVNAGSLIEDNSATAKGKVERFTGAVSATGGGFTTSGTAVVLDTALVRNNTALAQSESAASASAGGGSITGGTFQMTKTQLTGNRVRAEALIASEESITASAGGLLLDNLSATVTESLIASNTVTAESKAAGTFARALAGGVYLQAFGTATRTTAFTGSTLDANTVTALGGGGTAAGGGVYATLGTGTAVVLNANLFASAVTNNVAKAPGSALGGGLYASAGTGDTLVSYNIINSTISGNLAESTASASNGGGIYGTTGTGSAKVTVSLAASTITGNRALGVTSATGGGVRLLNGISSAITTGRSRGSIVAGNLATTDPDCSSSGSTLVSNDYNLLGVVGSCTFTGDVANNRTGAAGLGPLADNGGPTKSHALLAGSQAIDTSNPLGCQDPLSGRLLTTDQRGLARPVGGRCDIGAFELQ